MSEAPRRGSGGLCSNRLDEFSMTGTADALNRRPGWSACVGRRSSDRTRHGLHRGQMSERLREWT